ncbi:MAG: zf-HC2 domain-containing protein [Planctomycetota bacterium]
MPTPDPTEHELWRLYSAAAPPVTGECPSLIDLAAYIDRRASESQRRAIEAHLAQCSGCLKAVGEIGLRPADRHDPSAPAPPSVIESAKALVPGPACARHSYRFRLPDTGWPAMARWSATAAASIAICFVGYQAGSRSLAPQESTALVGEMSFGVLSPPNGDEPELDRFALALEEASR